MFESSFPSEAHRLLKEAPARYRDIPPDGSMPLRPRPPDRVASPAPPSPSERTPAAAKAAAIADGTYVEKPKVDTFKKKVLAQYSGLSLEDASKQIGGQQATLNKELADLEAVEAAKQKAVDECEAEFNKAKAAVTAAQDSEINAAGANKAALEKRQEFRKAVEEARKELYEKQRAVAMIEVMAVNHAKMKALEEAKEAAQKAAAEAKASMLAQKQREKEALEATKRALAEARQGMKDASKKAKTVHPDEAATQAADID